MMLVTTSSLQHGTNRLVRVLWIVLQHGRETEKEMAMCKSGMCADKEVRDSWE